VIKTIAACVTGNVPVCVKGIGNGLKELIQKQLSDSSGGGGKGQEKQQKLQQQAPKQGGGGGAGGGGAGNSEEGENPIEKIMKIVIQLIKKIK